MNQHFLFGPVQSAINHICIMSGGKNPTVMFLKGFCKGGAALVCHSKMKIKLRFFGYVSCDS